MTTTAWRLLIVLLFLCVIYLLLPRVFAPPPHFPILNATNLSTADIRRISALVPLKSTEHVTRVEYSDKEPGNFTVWTGFAMPNYGKNWTGFGSHGYFYTVSRSNLTWVIRFAGEWVS